MPVEPELVQQTIAARSSVSATCRAAAAIASAPVASGSVRRTCSDGRYIALILHFLGDAVHGRHRLDRILAGRRFRRQHHRVGAVEDRGGDVGDLRARRHRACDHRFQHLGRDNHRLAGVAAGARHFLLHARHFLQRHLDAEIAARHHQRVGEVENVVQSRHRLRLLDLGHHRSAAARDLLRLGDVFRPLDEGERDPIDAGIERCFEIGEVLRRQRGDRNDRYRAGSRLCGLRILPPTFTRATMRSGFVSVTISRSLPSSIRSVSPALMAAKISGCGRWMRVASPGVGSVSRIRSWPASISAQSFLKLPSRNFGPCRSTRMPIGRS